MIAAIVISLSVGLVVGYFVGGLMFMAKGN